MFTYGGKERLIEPPEQNRISWSCSEPSFSVQVELQSMVLWPMRFDINGVQQ